MEIPLASDQRKKVEDLTNLANDRALKEVVTAIHDDTEKGNTSTTLSIRLPGPVIQALKDKGYSVSTGDSQKDGPWAVIGW